MDYIQSDATLMWRHGRNQYLSKTLYFIWLLFMQHFNPKPIDFGVCYLRL